jgi:deoxyxylulose-5-phosphate synthase
MKEDCLRESVVEPGELKPGMKSLLNRVVKCCQNFVMVLPANINVNGVGEVIADVFMSNNIIVESCSVRMEKIIYGQEMKYIILYYGIRINN